MLNGMSAFALAAAWGWGMSEIFRIEMDTKVILLGLLLISMLFSAGYGMSRVGGIGAGLGARQLESGISGTSVSGWAEGCSDNFGKGQPVMQSICIRI